MDQLELFSWNSLSWLILASEKVSLSRLVIARVDSLSSGKLAKNLAITMYILAIYAIVNNLILKSSQKISNQFTTNARMAECEPLAYSYLWNDRL